MLGHSPLIDLIGCCRQDQITTRKVAMADPMMALVSQRIVYGDSAVVFHCGMSDMHRPMFASSSNALWYLQPTEELVENRQVLLSDAVSVAEYVSLQLHLICRNAKRYVFTIGSKNSTMNGWEWTANRYRMPTAVISDRSI